MKTLTIYALVSLGVAGIIAMGIVANVLFPPVLAAVVYTVLGGASGGGLYMWMYWAFANQDAPE